MPTYNKALATDNGTEPSADNGKVFSAEVVTRETSILPVTASIDIKFSERGSLRYCANGETEKEALDHLKSIHPEYDIELGPKTSEHPRINAER